MRWEMTLLFLTSSRQPVLPSLLFPLLSFLFSRHLFSSPPHCLACRRRHHNIHTYLSLSVDVVI
eukprot:m.251157 g.251157  ORF g.251157 m.251157 type:complete len:64 (+) comp17183_c0_seq1:71-262(+)